MRQYIELKVINWNVLIFTLLLLFVYVLLGLTLGVIISPISFEKRVLIILIIIILMVTSKELSRYFKLIRKVIKVEVKKE